MMMPLSASGFEHHWHGARHRDRGRRPGREVPGLIIMLPVMVAGRSRPCRRPLASTGDAEKTLAAAALVNAVYSAHPEAVSPANVTGRFQNSA